MTKHPFVKINGDLYVPIENSKPPRCKDCSRLVPMGYVTEPEFSNAAEKPACGLLSRHDFDWDYTSFWYVDPEEDYCSWFRRKEQHGKD